MGEGEEMTPEKPPISAADAASKAIELVMSLSLLIGIGMFIVGFIKFVFIP